MFFNYNSLKKWDFCFLYFRNFLFLKIFMHSSQGWAKKLKNQLKWENKNNNKKIEPWKKQIKPIKIMKKSNPNRAKPEKKPSQTSFCPKKPNWNRLVWTGFGFFKKNFNLIIFFNKNRTKSKMITPKSPSCIP
jgi:hypothetical protein